MSEINSRRLIPWLVTASDLQRYLGRACTQCARGRVLFFYYAFRSGPKRGTRHLVCLVPITGSDMLVAALVDYLRGRYRCVQLSTLRKRGPKDRRAAPVAPR